MTSSRNFTLALIQMMVGKDKSVNVQRAVEKIAAAAAKGADVVVLPECFNAPYGNEYFKEYSESVPGPSTDQLRMAAKTHGVDLIGGSIPEAEGDKLFNTCPLINRNGDLVAKFRKLHLFDIDVPGKISFQESKTLSAGSQPTVFKTTVSSIGIGLCYDIRFSELARCYADVGCDLLVYPGAFNMTTGPAHWELIARSRAVDNQVFTALCAPARDPTASYVAWGHSLVVDPWGKVIASTEEAESTIFANIDLKNAEEIRKMIPIRNQKREDLFNFPSFKNQATIVS